MYDNGYKAENRTDVYGKDVSVLKKGCKGLHTVVPRFLTVHTNVEEYISAFSNNCGLFNHVLSDYNFIILNSLIINFDKMFILQVSFVLVFYNLC